MPSLLPIVLLTAAVAGQAPVSAARQTQQGTRPPRSSSPSTAPTRTPVTLTASLSSGWIEGLVTDDRNQPIAGAAVTAQGRDLLIIETSRDGRFELRGIPAGTYLLRVQGRGFAASRREFVQVVPARGTHFDVQLRRAAAAAMAPGAPVMAAGVGLTPADAIDTSVPASSDSTVDTSSPESVPHDHSSAAWRLRHAKRSVLRDTTSRIDDVAAIEDEELWTSRPDFAEWTMGIGRAAASAVLNGALTGRVQLLTAGAIDQPFEAFTTDDMPAGIAFLHLAGPLSTRTTWSVEAATARGGVNSWFVGGTYATVVADSHGVEVHSSYSRQTSAAANGVGVYGLEDDGRSAGGVAVIDHWTISPRAMLDVGGRYERYDYLRDPGLFSPTITASFAPTAGTTWIRVTATRDMAAPGAEEFVPQAYGSLTLPPQRTFSALVPGQPLEGQETRHLGIALEQDIATFRLSVSHFRQAVDGQLATVFDPNLALGQRRADLSHYGVASVGDFAAQGWGFGVSRPLGTHLRGGIEYRTSEVDWYTGDDVMAVGRVAPSAVRPAERMHDVTMRVDAAAPGTGTRLSAACRFNTRFTRGAVDDVTPAGATRYDVQVYQGIPFLSAPRAQVELVFAVRNLIRGGIDSVSLYDELLVVRPPTRVVGGVTVQF